MKRLISLLAIVLLPASALAGEPPALSDQELAATRGGLMTPSGIEFGFGAVVRTYVDGQLALQTDLTWTDAGVVETSGLAGETATVVPGVNGSTLIMHDIDAGRIASLVLNTADGRDIRQDTDIVLNLPQLEQYKADAATQALAANLRDAATSALQQAGR